MLGTNSITFALDKVNKIVPLCHDSLATSKDVTQRTPHLNTSMHQNSRVSIHVLKICNKVQGLLVYVKKETCKP